MAERDAYPLPRMTLPGHSFDVLNERIRDFEQLCAEHGVSTRDTRIDRYRKYLEQPRRSGWQLDKGTFTDPPSSPIRSSLDRLLYVLREVHELAWIGEGLRNADTHGLADKLRIIVRGADFAALDRHTESRNTQFELRIASYLARSGYQLDFGTLTDIIATHGGAEYYIECKRVASPAQLPRRIKEALKQIEQRKPQSTFRRERYGVVAADVTKVAFAHNGLTMGATSDHARDVIQTKLQDIGDLLQRSPLRLDRQLTGIWLQIHIASLVLQPPTPTTRFSSLFMSNPSADVRSSVAAGRFVSHTTAKKVFDPDEQEPKRLKLRSSVTVPAGTIFSFDEKLLEELVEIGDLPQRAEDHLVLTLRYPNSPEDEEEHYSYWELTRAFAGLSADDRQRVVQSVDEARLLIGPLTLQRYPYVGNPPWLDSAEEDENSAHVERDAP